MWQYPLVLGSMFFQWLDDMEELDYGVYAMAGIAAGLTIRQIKELRSEDDQDE